MTDGRGHIRSEQSCCRWTVCMCVYIFVCVCVCGLVTPLSRLHHCYTKALECSHVGAAVS